MVLGTQDEIISQCVLLSDLVDATDGAKTWRLVLVDANRDSPFSEPDGTALGDALPSYVAKQRDLFLGYSASSNAVSLNLGGPHSPFAAAVMSNLNNPQMDVHTMFSKIMAQVKATTENRQEPVQYSSLPAGDFVLEHR